MNLISLALGGALGTLARYILSEFMRSRTGSSFPWGTLAVNTLGCFAAGFILSILLKNREASGPAFGLFWLTGFCGGFTTFSALVLESSSMASAGRGGASMANVALSLALGFAAFILGRRLLGPF